MSSAKKPIRRGRQKKQLLDDEDLQKQQQLEKAIQQGRIKPQSGDIFDTAKLDKNYFVRQQNKTYHHQAQIFNFDEQADNKEKQPQQLPKRQQRKPQKKNTQTKRRDQRRKQKNENIFDEQDQTQDKQEELIIPESKIDKNTQQINKDDKQQPMIKHQVRLQQAEQKEQKRQIQTKVEQKKQDKYDEESDQKQEESDEQQQQDDEQLQNAIKQKAQKSQDQQKLYILHKQLAKLSKEDRKPFYYQTLEPNHVAFAYFKRFTSGLSEVYQLCGEDHRPLLFCENQRGCIGANYYISMTKQMDKNNPNYLGKLRGNAAGSTYFLYDDGIQPKNQLNRSDWRVSLAAIEYENNFMGMNGPRKMKVITPSAKLLEDADTFKLSQDQSLLNFQPPIITQFRNKTPKWNEKLKSYALNFGGRVKMASIKNFILIENSYEIDDEDDAQNVIVFGKIDETTFSMEYRYPLSLLQAFGIVMSEFDFKINCQ